MGTIQQVFEFKTKKNPKTSKKNRNQWENVPLASMPPSFDIAIPKSIINALSQSMQAAIQSWDNLSQTVEQMTQNLQRSSCALGGLVDSLKNAQDLADSFAKGNNKTKIYFRQLGLQDKTFIQSESKFLTNLHSALYQVGDSPGLLPNILPSEITIEPKLITGALISSKTPFGGGTILGNASTLFKLEAGMNAGLEKLSNEKQLEEGFSDSKFSSSVLSFTHNSGTTSMFLSSFPKTDFNSLIGRSFTISNSKFNDGNFTIKSIEYKGPTPIGGEKNVLIKYDRSSTSSELSTSGIFTIELTGNTISTEDKIRSILSSRKLLPTANSSSIQRIPVINLVDILIEEQIIGTDPEFLESDREIAIDRLSRIAGKQTKRVGGILMVGQAPDLEALTSKVKMIAGIVESFKPLADNLQTNLLLQELNKTPPPSGIEHSDQPTKFKRLDSQNNVGVLDALQAIKNAVDSGVDKFKLPELFSWKNEEPQPPEGNFNLWRGYSPIDFIPGLNALGKIENEVSSLTGGIMSKTFSSLGSLIQTGQNNLEEGMNQLQGYVQSIHGVTNQLNKAAGDIESYLDKIKFRVGLGPTSMKAKIIGADLNLLSNQQFYDECKKGIRDFSDNNRPTFGNEEETNIWFGIVIFIVGEDRQQLADQLVCVGELLAMDTSSVAVSGNKPRLTL